MKKFFIIALSICAMSMTSAGCTYHLLSSEKPDPDDSQYKTTTGLVYAWGLAGDFKVAEGCEEGIAKAQVVNAIPNSFITVLSLGIVTPVTFGWVCQTPNTGSGTISLPENQ